MARNLDMAAMRAFVTVLDAGGVTRAAARLNLTQSAVSMQLKRLEQMLGTALLDRAGRGVALTAEGEQFLSHARRIVELNDEAWARMTCCTAPAEIGFGVPHDLVYPQVPDILRRFARAWPRVQVTLESSFTRTLKAKFADGALDLILTTEDGVEEGGETLALTRLAWVGAPGGTAWRQRPLRLAFETACIFRPGALRALDAAGIPWQMAVQTDNIRSAEAIVAADLAIHAALASNVAPAMEIIRHGGALPELPEVRINLYAAADLRSEAGRALRDMIRAAFGGSLARAAE